MPGSARLGSERNGWLITAGLLSAGAAILHIGVIFGGPAWYRFFGAGEAMARLAEQGSARPALTTLVIALILSIWALYAFAAAGLVRRLPLMRTALVAITTIYLLRGLLLFPLLIFKPEAATEFVVWSSLVVLAYGTAYAVGTWRAWPGLSRPAG
jgi:hypothetical protein